MIVKVMPHGLVRLLTTATLWIMHAAACKRTEHPCRMAFISSKPPASEWLLLNRGRGMPRGSCKFRWSGQAGFANTNAQEPESTKASAGPIRHSAPSPSQQPIQHGIGLFLPRVEPAVQGDGPGWSRQCSTGSASFYPGQQKHRLPHVELAVQQGIGQFFFSRWSRQCRASASF